MAGNGIDTSILHKGAHSASYFDLARSAGEGVEIVDFCIPCNPYFPTPEMFDELSRDLKNILKYYPSDSSSITKKLCSVLGLHPQTVAMANGSTELITWIDRPEDLRSHDDRVQRADHPGEPQEYRRDDPAVGDRRSIGRDGERDAVCETGAFQGP